MNKFLLWLVMDSGIKLGSLAPYVFGLAIGRWPHKVCEAVQPVEAGEESR